MPHIYVRSLFKSKKSIARPLMYALRFLFALQIVVIWKKNALLHLGKIILRPKAFAPFFSLSATGGVPKLHAAGEPKSNATYFPRLRKMPQRALVPQLSKTWRALRCYAQWGRVEGAYVSFCFACAFARYSTFLAYVALLGS